MKTLLIRAAITVVLGLAGASMWAQNQTTASSGTTYIETSKFIGQKVKSAQGDEIGTVKDIVLDRSTGCLAYTVVTTSGGGGARASGGGKLVAVPWAVYSPSSDLKVLTVTVDRDRIYNAPVFDYARIEEYSRPDYISNVYSYYGVSGGAAVGVGVSGTTTTGTTTTGTTTTTGAAAGTSTRGGAGASPGGAAAPAATAARGVEASPVPRGTPAATPRATQAGRTRPTAAPSTGDREAGTPPGRRMRGATDSGSRPEAEQSQPERSRQSERDAGTRESRPDSEHSAADQSTSREKTTGTRHRERTGKRETSSPPEQPQEKQ
jgi:sporulation protein YlmC with PRC-barrel domain